MCNGASVRCACHSCALLTPARRVSELCKAGEASPRALRLTARCIALCPGHYSAWQCRRRVRRARGAAQAEWAAELDLVDAAAARGAKNYQVSGAVGASFDTLAAWDA